MTTLTDPTRPPAADVTRVLLAVDGAVSEWFRNSVDSFTCDPRVCRWFDDPHVCNFAWSDMVCAGVVTISAPVGSRT